MNRKKLKEILAAHADQLVNKQTISEDYLNLLSEKDEELIPLLSVAERLQSTLKPISPTDKFEDDLKRELLTIAHIRQAQGYIPPHPFRDFFMVLATLAFILSLVTVFVSMHFRTEQGRD